MITVFTPTYNRAKTLPRLYNSLCEQSDKKFEWLVVDDGSTDNTADLFKEWIKTTSHFNIKYIQQQNGGKHRAINNGVKNASGELFFIVDSDDQLPVDSISFVSEKWAFLRTHNDFAGISGIDVLPDGTIAGNGSDFGVIDSNSIEIRTKYNVQGDLSEVFRTEILKEFPFPEFEGEKFCPEALVWNRIATKYRIRYYSEPIYICEYLPDGLSAKIAKIRKYSPLASMTYYSEFMRMRIPFKEKIKSYINLWRFTPPKYFIKGLKMGGFLGSMFIIPGWLYRLKEYRL